MLAAFSYYWHQLGWAEGPEQRSLWAELACDFWASTGITAQMINFQMKPANSSNSFAAHQRFFIAASKALLKLGRSALPCRPSHKVQMSLPIRQFAGFLGWRPCFRNPDTVHRFFTENIAFRNKRSPWEVEISQCPVSKVWTP